MPTGILIGLTKARIAVLVAGLAWFAGLEAPPILRLTIGVLVLIAIAFDGLLDEQRIAHHTAPSAARDRYHSAA